MDLGYEETPTAVQTELPVVNNTTETNIESVNRQQSSISIEDTSFNDHFQTLPPNGITLPPQSNLTSLDIAPPDISPINTFEDSFTNVNHIEQSNSVSTNNFSAASSYFKSQATGKLNEEELKLVLAATCIEDACYGRTLEYNTDETSLLCYKRYSYPVLKYATLLFMWLLIFLALFEDPAVPGLAVPYWGTMLIELLCLGVIMFRMYQLSQFVPRHALIKDPKNVVIGFSMMITIIDMIIYIGMINSPSSALALRVSRMFRPFFIINMNESRQVRRAFRNIRNTIPEILNVLVLFFFSIALFTLLAFKLFEFRGLEYRDGTPYFREYFQSFFDLYVLVTTANSPDVMMPAYDSSSWFALFFIAYIIMNTYIFMNLFLAVIYNSYRSHLKTEIRMSVLWKREKLEKAFNLIKEDASTETEEGVNKEKWGLVMKKINYAPSRAKIELFWEVLTRDVEDNMEEFNSTKKRITKEHFLQVANLLNVNVVEDGSSTNIFHYYFPQVYQSKVSKFLRKMALHRYFVYFFDALILANAVCIALNYEDSEWFFLSIFILEILLKIYAYGPVEYFSFDRLWNWFDFIIIVSAFIATVVEASLNELAGFPREALDFLLVMRCLRVVRIVGNVDRFKVIILTMVNIAPSLLTYGVVLLMLYYSFAIVGMESFGGKVEYVESYEQSVATYCNNPLLKGTEFVRMGYCNNNFNDILHSMVTLVELTVVNQWHVIATGFSTVTNNGAKVYFILFHLTVVILIMNIIVAFVLEAFILEYKLCKSTIEDAVEKTIQELGLNANDNVMEFNHDRTLLTEHDGGDNDLYIEQRHNGPAKKPKHLFKINQGHKNIEVLLQKMFEEELNLDETLPKNNQLTLDGVTESSVLT